MRDETTKAVTELLAQMTATLNGHQIDFQSRQDAIRDLSLSLATQVRMPALSLPEPPKVHWVGSTMVV